MLWSWGMTVFFQALYFRCLFSNIVNWVEIQEATKHVRKRFVGGTFPFFGWEICLPVHVNKATDNVCSSVLFTVV